MNQVVSDEVLIKAYLAGDEKPLEILIQRHKKKVFSYILNITKNRHLAEDLFQDTFIKVINILKSGTYNEEGKFIQWVMRIAHNLVIDYFRKNSKMTFAENHDDYNIFDTLIIVEKPREEQIIFEQILKDVKSLVEYLPDDQKQVLLMRHFENLSFKEIAEKTNVSINTALGRMRYALINLRKIIQDKKIIMEV